jgi:hypothetical protein
VRQVQQALVQNNHFSEGPNPSFFLVAVNLIESLLFQGNHCLGTAKAQVLLPVLLSAERANINGNVVEFTSATALWVFGEELLVSANAVRAGRSALLVSGFGFPGLGRVVLTSNLTTGIFAGSTGTLVRASNIPPP